MEADRRAAVATAAAMDEAERKIQRETPPEGFRVDTLQRVFEGDSASTKKKGLDAEDSPSNKGSGCATRPCRKG